ncbi:MAG TPA: DoxX family protein [Solirubrobacteraceae bacterium]|nr:DoxX family protein [Solirubrobacteraceae bacterium]
MKLFFLLVRLLLGGLFFGHGMQKLKGWFDGYGPDGTGQFFESLGMRPGRQHALAAGASEAGGGAALALGFATPAAAAAITGVMTTAIRTVHQPNGPWVDRGGWEYPAMIIAAVLAITEAGPGPLSLDAALGQERKGLGWALAALAAGVGGSAVLLRDWERPDTAEEAPADAPAEAAPAREHATA